MVFCFFVHHHYVLFFRFWNGKNQLYLVQKLFFLTILLATGIFFILESRDTIIQLSSSSLLIEEKFPSFSKDIIMLFTIIVRSFGLVRWFEWMKGSINQKKMYSKKMIDLIPFIIILRPFIHSCVMQSSFLLPSLI